MNSEQSKDMERLHQLSSNNKRLIELSNEAACFHCQTISDSADIEYVEVNTAVCPKCGIDSMVPVMNSKLMRQMRIFWF